MGLPDVGCKRSMTSDTQMYKTIRLLLLAFFFLAWQVSACTIFTIVKDKTVLMAGNEDQTINNAYLVVDPTGKYGAVFFATPLNEIPLVMQMGINEMGLSYDINAISSEKLNRIPNAIPQKEWALVTLMKEVASVDELLARFFSYDWGTSIAYQIHVADQSGDAAVIHPGADGKLTYTRMDKAKGYLVSANFNVRDTGYYQYLPGRYQTADKALKKLSGKQVLNTAFMASVLEKTHQESGWIDPARTIFSIVFNLTTLDITLYYESNFAKPYVLNVRSALSKTQAKKVIPLPEFISSITSQ